MTLDQFRQLAETWGGTIDRWPSAAQDAARELAPAMTASAFWPISFSSIGCWPSPPTSAIIAPARPCSPFCRN